MIQSLWDTQNFAKVMVTVNKLTNHLENKPGVKTEVDWSGPTTSYVDTSTGEVVTVYLLPPCLTASILTLSLLAT